MARCRLYLLTAVFCTVIVLGLSDVTTEPPSSITLNQSPKVPDVVLPSENPEKKDVPPAVSATSSDSASTTTQSTTTQPTTTQSTTTQSTTTQSTTTSSTTTSTTTPSTTTSSTTTTTAPSPAPPTPTPAPGPVPAPQQNTWNFTDSETNITCVIVQFAAQLDVTYPKTVNNTAELGQKVLNVPVDAAVTAGGCGNSSQWLTLGWTDAATPDAYNSLTLAFVSNATTKTYELQSLNITLGHALFPNMTSDVQLQHGAGWSTPLATSYRCEPATLLPLGSDAPNVAGNLTLTHLQEEAFRTAHGPGFSAARECGGGDVPDAVPIAVGCALGALVLIVLVAYLVARRRSAARGYLSM